MDSRLKLIIKFAAIALTTPATLEVAGSIYPDNLIYRIMVQIAALVLVEGTLMLGWHKLDTDQQATIAQRWLYASIAMVAYGVLWAVAIAHQEGGAAWFRATLGVLLMYSIAESGILAQVKLGRAIDRDVNNALSVKRTRRAAAINDAKAEIQLEYQLRSADRMQRAEHEKLLREQQSDQLRIEAELKHERALKLLVSDAKHSERPIERNRSKRRASPHDLNDINALRVATKHDRREQLKTYMAEKPNLSEREYKQWIRATFGVADSTAWNDFHSVMSQLAKAA